MHKLGRSMIKFGGTVVRLGCIYSKSLVILRTPLPSKRYCHSSCLFSLHFCKHKLRDLLRFGRLWKYPNKGSSARWASFMAFRQLQNKKVALFTDWYHSHEGDLEYVYTRCKGRNYSCRTKVGIVALHACRGLCKMFGWLGIKIAGRVVVVVSSCSQARRQSETLRGLANLFRDLRHQTSSIFWQSFVEAAFQ
jgi:hypothetical protein